MVPTRGRHHKLNQCLQSIEAQTYRDWEVIVVDDNDDDSLQDLTHKRVRASHITEGFPVHNIGIAHSNSDIIFRLDDDIVLEPTFLELALPGFDDPSVVAVGGIFSSTKRPYESLRHGKGNHLFFCHTVNGISIKHTLDIQLRPHSLTRWLPVEHIHSSYLYRKSAMLEIGGFNESIKNGEETIPFIHWGFLGYKSLVNTACKATHATDEGGWRSSKRFFPKDQENLEKLIKDIFDKYGKKLSSCEMRLSDVT